MKKIQITNIGTVAPTSTENIATGYNVGQWWENTTTGSKYYHKTDGVWVELGEIPTVTTGTYISWTSPLIYNTPTSPGTTNITNTVTDAKLGVIQKIYHQSGTAPTFPVGWVKLSGNYSTTLLNIIYAEWVTGTRVEYWIINI